MLAGHAGLQREVTWATRLRPTPPAFEHLAGGELVLLPPDVLELLDERLTLADAIHQLSSVRGCGSRCCRRRFGRRPDAAESPESP